jgi:excisionase family DNA binding protein
VTAPAYTPRADTCVASCSEVPDGAPSTSYRCEDERQSFRCVGEKERGENTSEKTREPDDRPLPPVLTVEELAAFLRVNHKTVREAIERGDVPGVRRLGTTIRVSRDTVLAWLSSGQGRVSRSKRFR